jgi:hypothetical protein
LAFTHCHSSRLVRRILPHLRLTLLRTVTRPHRCLRCTAALRRLSCSRPAVQQPRRGSRAP